MTDTAATEQDLFARLRALDIATQTVRHAPVFTVEESRALRGEIPGGHCKCLFLKDKANDIWLVVADEERSIDLKALARHLGVKSWSFGKPELLRATLGVEPGAVTPFGLINEAARTVHVVLDATMLRQERVNFHPLHNAATTTIATADLQAFIVACGQPSYIIDLDALTGAVRPVQESKP